MRDAACILIAAVALGAGADHAEQLPTFRSGAEAVRVDVLVIDGSRPVAGLQSGDFEVRDDGIVQRIDSVSYESLPISLVVALDVSASVRGDRLASLVEAGEGLVDALKPVDQVTLLAFNHAMLRVGPTSDAAWIRAALRSLRGSGATSLRDAVHAAVVAAESGVEQPLVVVFSDGEDTTSWLDDADTLDTIRRSEAVVYAVTVGAQSSPFLKDATREAGGSLLEIGSHRDLKATFVRVLEEFKRRYVVGFTPAGVPGAGWHRLDVRIKGRRCTVKARPGYFR
jgi:VWFA-related protein